MPKAKIESTNSPQSGSSSVSRTPVKINSTQTPVWYKVLMFGFMLIGLGWLLV
ncbi:cell division protein CrgA, partial [Corynebacterium amycolatum]|uniref:cell division protein CrgA n=1 Tax=Corynebacterium amycolatum TaxID=43765 RepID=UPI00399AE478